MAVDKKRPLFIVKAAIAPALLLNIQTS